MRLAQALEHTLATRLFSATPLARCGQASISCIRMGFLGGMFDRACRIESRHRSGGVGRHHRRRLPRGRLFLLEGSPGTGKTTIATQFLMAGAAAGERTLYITLSETEDELRAGAASHGWSLERRRIFELVPPESLLDEEQQQSLLYSSDLELGETTKRIFEAFEQREARPRRARQPVGNPPARAKLAALSPPDPRAEALFRAQRRDRADARRSDRARPTTGPCTASRTA